MKRMRRIVVLPLALGVAAVSTSAKPLQLLDAKNNLASAAELVSLTNKGQQGKGVSVVGMVGSRGSGKSSLLNEAFGTDFRVQEPLSSAPSEGVFACVSESVVLLDCDGTEAAALSGAVCDALVLNIYASDVGRRVKSNFATVKAICSEHAMSKDGAAADAEEKERTPLIVAVHDASADIAAEELQAAIIGDLNAAWSEVTSFSSKAGQLTDHFDVSVVALGHPSYKPSAYTSSAAALKQSLLKTTTDATGAEVAARFSEAWTRVRSRQKSGSNSMYQTSVDLLPVYRIDDAFTSASKAIEGNLKAWRATVFGTGKLVKGFGDKVAKLKSQVLKDFDESTLGYGVTALRGKRRAELISTLDNGVGDLFASQLQMLVADANKAYKKELLRLHAAGALDEDADANVLRKTLFSFEAAATDLVPSNSDLDIEAAYEELEADLQKLSENFTESPAAQLKVISKMEKQVQKSAKRGGKGGRSISAGFGLVGMMRQSGPGNLQGIAGYRRGPHTISLGYANDVDVGEDGEGPPLMRIQPKLNLDIDL